MCESTDSKILKFIDNDIKDSFFEWDVEEYGARPLSLILSIQQFRVIKNLTIAIEKLGDAYSSQNNSSSR